MKRLTTIFSLILISICAYATNIQGYEKVGDDGVKIKTLNEDETNTLTIANAYNLETKEPDDDPSAWIVKEIGAGTVMMKNDVAGKYTKIVINAKNLNTINALAFSNLINVTTFEIVTATPPSISETSFPATWLTTCELVVPDEALEAYKASEWVKYFYKINGEIIDHTTTAIGDNEVEKLNITTTNNTIRLNENVDVVVYSITGQQIYNGTTDVVTVPNSGIYIVKTNATTQKIMVK